MKKTLQILAFLAPIAMFLGSILTILWVGFDIPEKNVSNVWFYLDPAAYAFIIWQFIYIGFIVLGSFQLSRKYLDDPRFLKARKYIILNAMANGLWFVGSSFSMLWLTVVCMLTLLYTLIKLAVIFDLGKISPNTKETLCIRIPITLYFGWITLATPINISAFLLKELGWTGAGVMPPQIWSALVLAVASVIVSGLYLQKKVTMLFVFVAVWGLFAIYVANQSADNLVGYTALILSGLLLLLVFGSKLAKRNYPILSL